MKLTKKIPLLVLACLLVPSWASAGVLYDESVSGDLATFDPIVLVLQSGTNSVLGSSAYTPSVTDFDGFNISLGAGLTLESIDYHISNVSAATNTTVLSTAYNMTDGGHGGVQLAFTAIDILGGTPQAMFASALPTAGVFGFGTSPSFLARSGDGGSWDYEFRFTVSGQPVPEPATFAIFGFGALGLVGLRRRKRKQTA